jgi:hypothetical protein
MPTCSGADCASSTRRCALPGWTPRLPACPRSTSTQAPEVVRGPMGVKRNFRPAPSLVCRPWVANDGRSGPQPLVRRPWVANDGRPGPQPLLRRAWVANVARSDRIDHVTRPWVANAVPRRLPGPSRAAVRRVSFRLGAAGTMTNGRGGSVGGVTDRDEFELALPFRYLDHSVALGEWSECDTVWCDFSHCQTEGRPTALCKRRSLFAGTIDV